jgi:hypothetical protein
MQTKLMLRLLAVLNVFLAGWLVYAIQDRVGRTSPPLMEETSTTTVAATSSPPTAPETLSGPATDNLPLPAPPFSEIYSRDLKRFVANLRAVGCPETTIKDILMAEINGRHRFEENAMRPKPADHLPAGWSPHTSERKLLERRQLAVAFTSRKAALLREALG